MRILYLDPHPSMGRTEFYYRVAQSLEADHGAEVVFAYAGPVQSFLGSNARNFDQWLAQNHDRVAAADLLELERRFAPAQLWQALIAERRVTDYSYLNGAAPFLRYAARDLEFLAKAVALFYAELLADQPFDIILAQHPDNIHSVMLFEMGRHFRVPAVMLFRDYYWDPDSFHLFDDKYYRSSQLDQQAARNRAAYAERVAPYVDEIARQRDHKVSHDPKELQPQLLPTVGVWRNFRNAIGGLRNAHANFVWRRPTIANSYWQRSIPASIRAWRIRSFNLIRRRLSARFARELPTEPFFYFPIHLQPEATLLASAPAFSNQLAVIQAMSAALPGGVRLVVKDHPRIGGNRSMAFYSAIARLPNVVLMHEGFSNDRILNAAVGVATIRGTVGLQALLRGKPVVLLGHIYYDSMGTAIHVGDLNELPAALREALWAPADTQASDRAVFAFMRALETVSVRRRRTSGNESLAEKSVSYATVLFELFEKYLAGSRQENRNSGGAAVSQPDQVAFSGNKT